MSSYFFVLSVNICIFAITKSDIMTQIVLNVENQSVARAIRALLKNIAGVHIIKPTKKRKTGYELAMEDVKAGRIKEYSSIKELIDSAKSWNSG